MSIKEAQKRSLWDRGIEALDVPGKIMERLDDDFGQIMKKIRDDIDKPSREKAKELDSLIKLARNNLKEKEYLVTVANLAEYYVKLHEMNLLFHDFSKEVSQLHHGFLFEKLDQNQFDLLQKLNDKFPQQKKASHFGKLIKNAGLIDVLSNIFRSTGIVAWEKRFPKQFKLFRVGVTKQVDETEVLHKNLLNSFSKLSKHLARRNVEEYILQASTFAIQYEKARESFMKFYDSEVKKIIQMKQLMDENKNLKNPPNQISSSEQSDVDKAIEALKLENEKLKGNVDSDVIEVSTRDLIDSEPQPQVDSLTHDTLTRKVPTANVPSEKEIVDRHSRKTLPSIGIDPDDLRDKVFDQPESEEKEKAKPKSEPKQEVAAEDKPKSEKKPVLAPTNDDGLPNSSVDLKGFKEHLKQTSTHKNFINLLVKTAENSSKYELAKLIVRYSEKIESEDLKTSLKLLSIAQGILNE